MKPDAERIEELAATVLPPLRQRVLMPWDGLEMATQERAEAAITTALSERDAEWQDEVERWQGLYDMSTGNDDAIATLHARLEAAEARAHDAEQAAARIASERACEMVERRKAERQRDEALAQVARLRWAVREYADTSLLDDAEEGRCDCDAETEQCEFCGLREALLAAHPEPAEQAATDEEPGEGRS